MTTDRLPKHWLKHIEITSNGCWMWTACKRSGYGRATLGGRLITVHRVSYELYNGQIPDGLTIDHLCRNRACCNPLHLEAVTLKVNVLRGEAMGARHARATKCPKGHDYNIMDKQGYRRCRTCDKANTRRYWLEVRKPQLAQGIQ